MDGKLKNQTNRDFVCVFLFSIMEAVTLIILILKTFLRDSLLFTPTWWRHCNCWPLKIYKKVLVNLNRIIPGRRRAKEVKLAAEAFQRCFLFNILLEEYSPRDIL